MPKALEARGSKGMREMRDQMRAIEEKITWLDQKWTADVGEGLRVEEMSLEGAKSPKRKRDDDEV